MGLCNFKSKKAETMPAMPNSREGRFVVSLSFWVLIKFLLLHNCTEYSLKIKNGLYFLRAALADDANSDYFFINMCMRTSRKWRQFSQGRGICSSFLLQSLRLKGVLTDLGSLMKFHSVILANEEAVKCCCYPKSA